MSNWPFTPDDQFADNQSQFGDEGSQSDVKKVVPFAVRACDFCKKRKIRCEGTIPCVPCQRRGQVCSFSREQTKRGPKPKRRELGVGTGSARTQRDPESESSELVSLQPLTQDLSKLRIELEIQKRLEAHWKQQYFELVQQQQATQLAVGAPNTAAYLRSQFLDGKNSTGLLLDSGPDSPMIGQFSAASWRFVHDPDTPFKLQQLFAEGNICGAVPTYKMTLASDEPVNALIWKVLMNNAPEQIGNYLRHETTPLVMQFLQSAVIFAQGLRGLDEDGMYLDLGNHLLLVVNTTFNILFYQREVQYNVKYVKQMTFELLNLAQYLKYTGTGAASQQLSPILVQIVQQFESALDDPDLLANALAHLLIKAEDAAERDYWMMKLSSLPTSNPINRVLVDFSVVLSGLRVLTPQALTPQVLRELMLRIENAERQLQAHAAEYPSSAETIAFYSIWFHMARAELLYRLKELREHDIAVKETMRRYYSLPRAMFRKALRGLASLFATDGSRLITAGKLLQLAEPFPEGDLTTQSPHIVEINVSSDEVSSEVLTCSPHDSNESEVFEDFIFDPSMVQMSEAVL